MSPDEMTTSQVQNLIEQYERWRQPEKADALRAMLTEREAAGTLDVVPVVTPRHSYVVAQQDHATVA